MGRNRPAIVEQLADARCEGEAQGADGAPSDKV